MFLGLHLQFLLAMIRHILISQVLTVCSIIREDLVSLENLNSLVNVYDFAIYMFGLHLSSLALRTL